MMQCLGGKRGCVVVCLADLTASYMCIVVAFCNACAFPLPATYLLIGSEQNGSVLVSTDGGATWVPQTTIPSPGNWTAVAASTDGSTLVAVDSGGSIYINKNGVWAPATTAGVQPWSTVSVSADGKTIIAGTAGM